jgi:hypothetical protein
LGLDLQAEEDSVPTDLRPLKAQDFRRRQGVKGNSAELQEISRGIRPAILSKGVLVPALRTLALRTLARRSRVPVELDVGVRVDRRLPESVETAA